MSSRLFQSTDTCGLDPPCPRLKLGEYIEFHGCIIIFACFNHETFFLIIMSGDYVLHIAIFWLALHYVLEKMKNLLYLLYVDILGCFPKTVTELHDTSFMLDTCASVVIICKNIKWYGFQKIFSHQFYKRGTRGVIWPHPKSLCSRVPSVNRCIIIVRLLLLQICHLHMVRGDNGPFLTINLSMFIENEVANQWYCRAHNNLCPILHKRTCEQLT